jgi:hypothetical protein
MNIKTTLLLIAAALLLAVISCTTVTSMWVTATPQPTSTPLPTPTPRPTNMPLPTDTPTPTIEPEKLNEGINFYTVTKHEITCELTVTEEQQHREILFSEDKVSIQNRTTGLYSDYDLIEPHRYLRYNKANKPIAVEFSSEGFKLEVYHFNADPITEKPCGYFTFTLTEE